MPGNFKKEDLRIIKTYKVLNDALLKLLERRNFNRITVNDLCDEAQVSRATFYAHFKDKYDLLEHWSKTIMPLMVFNGISYEKLEEKVNVFISSHIKAIVNILEDANNETMEIVRVFMLSVFEMSVGRTEDKNPENKYIVWSNFCAGGMVYFLLWQLKHKFPKDLKMINIYFYKILLHLLEWREINENL